MDGTSNIAYSPDRRFRYQIMEQEDRTFQVRPQMKKSGSDAIWRDLREQIAIVDNYEHAVWLGDKTLKEFQLFDLLLQKSGWQEGCQIDPAPFAKLAAANQIPFTSAMERVIREFGELNAIVYVATQYGDGSKRAYDFTVDTRAKEAADFSDSEEYGAICAFAQEKVLCFGEIGYCYPAVCAVGESGSLYLCHNDAMDVIQKSDSMIESIAWELKDCNTFYV